MRFSSFPVSSRFFDEVVKNGEAKSSVVAVESSVRKRSALRVHAALVRAKHTVLKSLQVVADLRRELLLPIYV